MLQTLLISALLMGVAGGPHYLAMCGTACMGVSRWPGQSAARSLWLFQTGRVIGYRLQIMNATEEQQGLASGHCGGCHQLAPGIYQRQRIC
jgi:uncharacterized protein